MAQIVLKDLTLGYDRRPALKSLDGTIKAGSLIAVVGPNGGGKSTLLKGLAGLLRPLAGEIRRDGVASVAYLPQQTEIDRSFPASVGDLVALGLWRRRGLLGRLSTADRDAIAAALEAVGLAGFGRRGIDGLSGGELQRALFARVIVQDAPLILLDEPFNAIDLRTVADLMAIIHRWHGEGRTVLAVLHELDLVRAHFPQALLLAGRAVAWGGTAEALKAENLFTARQIAALIEHPPVAARSEAA
jgi:zinc/manganese transport system ATP-binding protein